MPKEKWSLGGYVEVRDRMAWFFDRYPEGSLQSHILKHTDNYIIVEARAYRTPDDVRPGVGLAYEPIPGTTPYTKDSEVMNAESSAWGRALAAIGAPTKDHVASSDEVNTRMSGSAMAEAGGTEAVLEPPTVPAHPCIHAEWEAVEGRPGLERCVSCGVGRKAKGWVTPQVVKDE